MSGEQVLVIRDDPVGLDVSSSLGIDHAESTAPDRNDRKTPDNWNNQNDREFIAVHWATGAATNPDD